MKPKVLRNPGWGPDSRKSLLLVVDFDVGERQHRLDLAIGVVLVLGLVLLRVALLV